ncbi:zliS Lysozyme family protein [uncultured Caudovirales phage]|uniref:ZliS Lysozyme family protein n=1 Tax=uncultured Caudovirales phage TaxID=2100421 RepID=A0A6J5QUV3_9CAUD|nr:zliS Lysozyme family protein [uncultured Caudovirales phage]
MNNFDTAFLHLIGVEGEYTSGIDGDSKNDPGGETKYGICKRAYPAEDIPHMTLDRAKMIYKRDYWDLVKGDSLPSPLDSLVFDCAVNQGVDTAIKLLQKTLSVAQDGIVGADTMRKASEAGKEVCALYLADRAMRYTGTRNFDKFGRGWMKRLFVLAMEI